MSVFIDTPSPFAPLDEWVAYRKQLEELTGVENLKREADEHIARLRAN